MKKCFFPIGDKGSIFIVTLNIIIILSVILLSLSFNTASRYRLANMEARSYQARLNANGGILLAMKEMKDGSVTVPFRKKYVLFHDDRYTVDVTVDYVIYQKNGNVVEIQPASGGKVVRIVAKSIFENTECSILKLIKERTIIFSFGN